MSLRAVYSRVHASVIHLIDLLLVHGRRPLATLSSFRPIAWIFESLFFALIESLLLLIRLQGVWIVPLGWSFEGLRIATRHVLVWVERFRYRHPPPVDPSKCLTCHATTSNCNRTFVYGPLDYASHQIRLVRLHDNNNDISFELATFSLDDAPPYSALSYRWTSEQPTCAFQLSTTCFFVRPHLFNYLRSLHRESQSGWQFIDAICIDQHNDLEKSNQVSLMRDIFRTAYQVVAWIQCPLNDAASESSANLTTIGSAEIETIFNDETINLVVGWFLFDDYWTRLWPVQEVLVARRLVFRCGVFVLEWDRLLAFIVRFRGPFSRRPLHTFLPAVASAQQLSVHTLIMMEQTLSYRRRFTTQGEVAPMSFHQAVETFAIQHCSDRRDKIFGLIGLTQSPIRADYRMEVEEVYVRALIVGMVELLQQQAPDGIASQTETIKPLEAVVLFCQALLLALGLDSLNSTVILLTKEVFDRFEIPAWAYDEISWLPFASRVPRESTQTVPKFDDPSSDAFARWVYSSCFHVYTIYGVGASLCRRRHRFSRALESWGVIGTNLADILVLPMVALPFLAYQLADAHNSLMSLPNEPHRVKPYHEWSRVARDAFRDLTRSGYIPKDLVWFPDQP